MSDDKHDNPTARATLAQLLEVLQAALEATAKVGESKPWQSDAIAGQWMRNEIAPLVDQLVGLAFVSQIGRRPWHERLPSPCPLCSDGEEVGDGIIPQRNDFPGVQPSMRLRPHGVSYSCGHWITFPYIADQRREAVDMLPMNSVGPIYPGQAAEIVVRPQRGAFRPQRIIVGGGNPAVWLVHDIRVGNRSQMSGRGPIDGAAFGPQGVDGQPLDLNLETIQTAQDFIMVVRYVGTNEAGEEFRAMVIGVEAR